MKITGDICHSERERKKAKKAKKIILAPDVDIYPSSLSIPAPDEIIPAPDEIISAPDEIIPAPDKIILDPDILIK